MFWPPKNWTRTWVSLVKNKIDYQNVKYVKNFVLIPLIIIFILSGLSVLTWIFGMGIGPYEINIHFKQNTALAFLFLSISTYMLWLNSDNKYINYIGRILATVVILIGVLTLYEKITGFNLGMDLPFQYDPTGTDPRFPGQMSSRTVITFILLGTALLMNSYQRARNKFATVLNSIVFFMSLVGIIAIIFDVQVFYPFQGSFQITDHIAICGLLAAFAGLFMFPQNKYVVILQSYGATGSFARSVSLASLILPILFSRLGIYLYDAGADPSAVFATVATASLAALIMITWKSTTAFEVINRDRIGSEKENLSSNAQIESLISSSSQGIAFFSPEGYIIRANDIFKKYLNVSSNKTDINSMPDFKTMIGLKPRESISDFIKSAGPGKNFEISITVDGENRYISLNLFPVQTKYAEFIGLGLSFIDITHLKQIEHELIVSRDRAEVSNRAKSFFLANMSHEIRTPIGVIMGFVDILNTTQLSDDEKRSNMSIIKRNCRQLLNIIDDILDLSKVEFGQIKIRRETINTLELLEDLKSILDLKTQDKSIEIDVKISGKVPATFSSDNTRLRQIILNICGNATKFTKTGSITVDCFFSHSQMSFRVTDTGPGVAVEDIHKLFKPFSQIDSSETREFGGTGLGLALSKKLAIALGGDLVLEKTVLQKGSTFLLYVDVGENISPVLIDQSASENIFHAQVPEIQIDSQQLKNKKILIVDDSPDNRLLLSFILKQFGALSDTANDGKAALEKALAQDSKFDLILMDLQMPIMGGYEAVSTLRKSGYDKPIIALTAHAMKEEKEKCMSNGFTNYLTKPIARNTLVDMISNSL